MCEMNIVRGNRMRFTFADSTIFTYAVMGLRNKRLFMELLKTFLKIVLDRRSDIRAFLRVIIFLLFY